MVTPLIKKLTDAKATVVTLQKSIAKELASLPSEYGFGSLEEFIAAVRTASPGAKRGPKGQRLSTRRKRSKITKETRARVKALVKAGKTGSAIAAALKISLPSVQNIKKALGLVKTFKKPVPEKKIPKPTSKRKVQPKASRKAAAKSAAPAPKSTETVAAPSQEPSK